MCVCYFYARFKLHGSTHFKIHLHLRAKRGSGGTLSNFIRLQKPNGCSDVCSIVFIITVFYKVPSIRVRPIIKSTSTTFSYPRFGIRFWFSSVGVQKPYCAPLESMFKFLIKSMEYRFLKVTYLRRLLLRKNTIKYYYTIYHNIILNYY